MKDCAYLIKITGQVQGVGFRPFIYLLARKYAITGWVKNTSQGVQIYATGSFDVLDWMAKIKLQAPPLSRIKEVSYSRVDYIHHEDFSILHSQDNLEADLSITPDCAICEACKQELFDPNNRRYLYPFITCTHCGPRYSIIKNIPYDRPLTTMNSFTMCSACHAEYVDPNNRRFYSQTNSCTACGIHLNGSIAEAVEQLRAGKIVAIKGISGYLLMVDACNEEAVDLLRKRKQRRYKPLALMVRDLAVAAHYVDLQVHEVQELSSTAAPIVLCERRTRLHNLADSVAFDSDYLGLLLPYSPLHLLLLNQFDTPLVATSANVSHSPIIYQDQDPQLEQLADYVLSHDREILVPQDDSVVRFSPSKQRIILRRARGIAPQSLDLDSPVSSECLLAMGSDLKNTLGYWSGKNLVINSYGGNFENLGTQNYFLGFMKHLISLYQGIPQGIRCDLNASYFSTQWAHELCAERYPMAKVEAIQHHHAHFYAILGEHRLLNSEQRVMGVIWDGMGLGTDGAIWGGEFFGYQQGKMERISHLRYYDYLLGDKMSKEARLSLLSQCDTHDLAHQKMLQSKFAKEELSLYSRMLPHNKLKTSSMGRLIDAVASLLLDWDYNHYEAEASMKLEQCAHRYLKSIDYEFTDCYASELLQTKALLTAIMEDLVQSVDTGKIASKFFNTLVYWIENVATTHRYKCLAFSGGVFQNSVLVELITKNLSGFQLFFHESLAPNDENISYGQLLAPY